MSKGGGFCSSMAQLTLERTYTCLSKLPLVVVCAVAGGAAGLLLSAYIDTQVAYGVVGGMAVHVVDQLDGGKRATQMLRHYPAVFEDTTGFAAHSVKQVQVDILDGVLAEADIAVGCSCAPARIA